MDPISKKILTIYMSLPEQLKLKTVKVSDKGQISIPSDIRREMKIKRRGAIVCKEGRQTNREIIQGIQEICR